jgi:hypothetical protein
MMKVAKLTDHRPGIALSSTSAVGSTSAHRMTLSTPSRPPSSPASGPLRREQIDALLEELRDPALARQFLMDAGLIDADGQLTPPYRSQDARSA